MDLNIKVKIDSPDILNGLLALADEISKIGVFPKEIVQAAQQVGKNETKEEVAREINLTEIRTTTTTIPPKEEPITLEKVRAVLAAKSQSGKQKEVKALITKYGAKKLTDIDPACYEELLKEAEVL